MRAIGAADKIETARGFAAVAHMQANQANAAHSVAAAATTRLALASAHSQVVAAKNSLAAAMRTMASIAVEMYTHGISAISSLFTAPTTATGERSAYIGAATHHLESRIAAARRIIAAWPARKSAYDRTISLDLAAAHHYTASAITDRSHIRSYATALGGTSAADFPAVATWASTGISRLALAAYMAGAVTANKVVPGCAISWNDIAAVGFIESRQGRYGNATIAMSGEVLPPILGVPLNGSSHTRKVPMAHLGIADGTGPYARAVGPLQFLPSTWVAVATLVRARTGIVLSDPNNFLQAAAAAGTTLCRGGSFVAGPSTAAYMSYNASARYAWRAGALANAYTRTAVPVSATVLWPPPPL